MFTAGRSSFLSNTALVVENLRLEGTSESSRPAFCPEAATITEGDGSLVSSTWGKPLWPLLLLRNRRRSNAKPTVLVTSQAWEKFWYFQETLLVSCLGCLESRGSWLKASIQSGDIHLLNRKGVKQKDLSYGSWFCFSPSPAAAVWYQQYYWKQ